MAVRRTKTSTRLDAVVALLFSCATTLPSLGAVTLTETIDGIRWSYYYSNGGAVIGNYFDGTHSVDPAISQNVRGTVAVPETIGGKMVTGIGGCAFWECCFISSFTLPDTVEMIGEDAFHGCRALKSIALPESLTQIGPFAFCGCTNLTQLTIPRGVASLGFHAFSGCDALTTLTLPRHLESDLEQANLPGSCTVVFYDSVNLTIASNYGTATPSVGTHVFQSIDTVSCSATPPVAESGVKYEFLGWSGTGSVPSSGNKTNLTFDIKMDSTLSWRWQKDNFIQVAATGDVSGIKFDNGAWGVDDTQKNIAAWVPNGRPQEVFVLPNTLPCLLSISGDTNEVSVVSDTKLVIPSDGPRNITISVSTKTAALEVKNGYGYSVPSSGTMRKLCGVPIHAYAASPSESRLFLYECTGWSGTGSVPVSGTGTEVTFTLEEDSTLSWNWRTNVMMSLTASGPVSADFEKGWVPIGDMLVAKLFPRFGPIIIELSGDVDGVVLDKTNWTLSIPADRPREVSVVACISEDFSNWMEENLYGFLDFESAAIATAANGRPVWECYVAGLDPTDPDDDLVAAIEIKDGVPIVGVGGKGERPGRTYVVEGKEKLSDQWGPTNAASRFFHVKAILEEN